MGNTLQKVHFIAIGGAVMHNLALELHRHGVQVTGSDDQIFEPSRSRLAAAGLLPEPGWEPKKITPDLDVVILGMHARADNPELIRARELGLAIQSFPEFIHAYSVDKQRIVIAGSHGKTTITSMIIHVLHQLGRDFDYLVGAQLPGFERMVKLSDAPVIIIEGDEYPTSALDTEPKFLKYDHHIALVSGISWDHVNVYQTFDDYVHQFDRLADATPKAGNLIYCEEDPLATVICGKEREDVNRLEYKSLPYTVQEGTFYVKHHKKNIPLQVFGKHNMQNMAGALTVLKRIGVTEEQFYAHIPSFQGASMRLETLAENQLTSVIRDFAHAPSKVQASTLALKELHPQRRLVACLELHTYSSLSPEFLEQYRNKFAAPDQAIVYFNPDTLTHKNLPPISEEQLRGAFERDDLIVFSQSEKLHAFLRDQDWKNTNLLFMSSGNFDNIDLKKFAQEIVT